MSAEVDVQGIVDRRYELLDELRALRKQTMEDVVIGVGSHVEAAISPEFKHILVVVDSVSGSTAMVTSLPLDRVALILEGALERLRRGDV